MTEPTVQISDPSNLESRQSADLDIISLFSDDLLDVTKKTRVTGRLITTYTRDSSPLNQEFVLIFTINNRNTITWDDDRKTTTFIAVKDPTVLSFSKVVAVTVGDNIQLFSDKNSLYAMETYEALGFFGISYVIDLSTLCKDLSAELAAS